MKTKTALTFGAITSACVLILVGIVGAQPVATSATGTWNVTYSTRPMSPSKMVLHQEGQTLIGTYGNGFNLNGHMNANNPQQFDATWTDLSGGGWATLIFSPDWKTFNGRWGYPGKQPAGTFVASRVYLQINTTGLWDVTLTGQATHKARLKFSQTGTSFVGTWPNGHLTGTIPPGEIEVHGSWQTRKNSGPITMTFTSDGQQFEGVWGYTNRPRAGRVFGKKVGGAP